MFALLRTRHKNFFCRTDYRAREAYVSWRRGGLYLRGLTKKRTLAKPSSLFRQYPRSALLRPPHALRAACRWIIAGGYEGHSPRITIQTSKLCSKVISLPSACHERAKRVEWLLGPDLPGKRARDSRYRPCGAGSSPARQKKRILAEPSSLFSDNEERPTPPPSRTRAACRWIIAGGYEGHSPRIAI